MNQLKQTVIKEYWLKKLSGERPGIFLPLGRRPEEEKAGKQQVQSCQLAIPSTTFIQLTKMAKNSDIALFILFLSALNITLNRYTGVDDLIVATVPPAVNGNHCSTLFCRTPVPGRITVREFVSQTKEEVLAAFNHAEYSLDSLLEELRLKKNTGALDISNVFLLYEPFQEKNQQVEEFDLVIRFFQCRGQLNLELQYSAGCSAAEMPRLFGQNLVTTLDSMMENTTQEIAGLNIIHAEEKKRLLLDFNSTGAASPGDKTIHHLFEEQVEKIPGKVAVVFGERCLTYSSLNQKSGCLAGVLKNKGMNSQCIAGLMVERSLEMMVGLLAILKAGGAYLPLDPDYPPKRTKHILESSSTRLLLTQPHLLKESGIFLPGGETLNISDENLYRPGKKTANPGHVTSAADLAYVIYTSGSTGSPKGVAVRHQNVVNFIRGMASILDLSPGKTILALTTISFDIFFLETLLPLTSGLEVIIVDEHRQRDPLLLPGIITRHHVNILQLTPSRLKLLLSQEEALTCLQGPEQLLVGGEAFPPHLCREIKKKYRGKLYNVYGPTETTIWSTVKDLSGPAPGTLTIGTPIANTQVYIVDKQLQIQPLGAVGELLIGGDGVAVGYLNNVELTAGKFLPVSHRSNKSFGSYISKRIYRTGDLARWLPHGEIEFLGRLDHQVKIRGYRVECEEIEEQLLNFAGIAGAVVLGKQDETGNSYLCSYIVSSHPPGAAELRDYLSRRLPGYMIPAYFIPLERIPLTSNGKVDRKALDQLAVNRWQLAAKEKYEAPGNKIEEKLVSLWQEILNVKPGIIGIRTNFFGLGGNSLNGAILLSEIHRVFAVKLSLTQLFKEPTIEEIAGYIEKAREVEYFSIKAVEEKEYHVLSPAQKRLYILQQMEKHSTAYNMPSMVNLEGKIHKSKLGEVFKKLVEDHQTLRTSFRLKGNVPVQRIHREVVFEMEYHEAGGEAGEEKITRDFIRPFDLSRAPLLRAGLIRKGTDRHILMVDLHHIISDGISWQIFFNRLAAFYAEKTLPPLRLRYKDYSEWQHAPQQKEAGIKAREYWLGQFPGDIPQLDLPIDYPRPPVKSFAGSAVVFEIPGEDLSKLKTLARQESATLYMVLLAVFNVLLAKISSREDIVVGTPVAGRRHGELRPLIGMFVNTLALRNFPSGAKGFRDFLREVRNNALDAFENQDHPFEELVDQLEVNRDTSRNPLFDVMFALNNQLPLAGISNINIPGLKFLPCGWSQQTSKFDLNLQAEAGNGKLSFTFEYGTKLFKEERVKGFVRSFKRIISTVTANPGAKISGIDILSEQEKAHLLLDFNRAESGYPGDKTLHQLFAGQVEKVPGSIALVDTDQVSFFSYKELNRCANRLARVLRNRGITTNMVVGLLMERCALMVIALLGALKAGGAYLPMVPQLPAARLLYLIRDSGAAVVLSHRDFAGELDLGEKLIRVHQRNLYEAPGSFSNPASIPGSQKAAYVIYTSGSTGKPKGVMVEHGSVVNMLTAMQREYPINETGAYLLKTSIIFDVSVTELFGWFPGGGRLCILADGGEKDPQKILGVITRLRITHINFVPSMFTVFLDLVKHQKVSQLPHLKYIFLAGETVLPSLIKGFADLNLEPPVILENLYGPTEGTVYSTSYSLDRWHGAGSVPIGKPLPNVKVFILDRYDGLRPMGVVGELVLSGAGVAMGYLNNPELTHERFINYRASGKNTKQPLKQKFCGVQGRFFKRAPGRRRHKLYKTGDLARWLVDGNIEFIGRIDQQVKIRGFRIEPGEVESHLLKYDGIKEVVVLAREDAKGDKCLCAYIVAVGEIIPSALREYLSGDLPEYMIPSYFAFLQQMPRTPSGKIDRQGLPGPEVEANGDYIEPRNKLEKKIGDTWAEVLGIEKGVIGIYDNFFQLGGHSLNVTVLMTKLRRQFNIEIPFYEIFKMPTISELAKYIKSRQEKSVKENLKRINKELKSKYGPKTQLVNKIVAGKEYLVLYTDSFIQEKLKFLESGSFTGVMPHYARVMENMPLFKNNEKITGKEEFAKILNLVDKESNIMSSVLYSEYKKCVRISENLNSIIKMGKVTGKYECGFYQKNYIKRKFNTPIFAEVIINNVGSIKTIFKSIVHLLNIQDIFRSTITKEGNPGKYFFVEFNKIEEIEAFKIGEIDSFFINLQEYSLDLQEVIIEKTKALLNDYISKQEVLDNFLFRFLIIKLNRVEYKILFSVNHLVTDNKLDRILNRYFENYFDNPQFDSGNPSIGAIHPYIEYLSEIRKASSLKQIAKFKRSGDYLEFKKCLLQLQEKCLAVSKINLSRSFIIECYFKSNNINPFNMSLYISVQVCSILFGAGKIPFRVFTDKRIFGEKSYYSTIGDMHDGTPVLFDVKQSLLWDTIKNVSFLDKKYQKNKFHFYSMREFDEEIEQVLFTGPIVFNFIGNFESNKEEIEFKQNYSRIRKAKDIYRIRAYTFKNKIGILFSGEIKEESKKEIENFLETLDGDISVNRDNLTTNA